MPFRDSQYECPHMAHYIKYGPRLDYLGSVTVRDEELC
jgi:hypothetical protein